MISDSWIKPRTPDGKTIWNQSFDLERMITSDNLSTVIIMGKVVAGPERTLAFGDLIEPQLATLSSTMFINPVSLIKGNGSIAPL